MLDVLFNSQTLKKCQKLSYADIVSNILSIFAKKGDEGGGGEDPTPFI